MNIKDAALSVICTFVNSDHLAWRTFKNKGGLVSADVARALSVSVRQANYVLLDLWQCGLVDRTQELSARQGIQYIYFPNWPKIVAYYAGEEYEFANSDDMRFFQSEIEKHMSLNFDYKPRRQNKRWSEK